MKDSILLCAAIISLAATAVAAEPADFRHPLDPLTRNEIARAAQLLKSDPRVPSGSFFPTLALQEPPKEEVLTFSPGKPFRREAYAEIFDRPHNALFQAIVDLRAQQIVSFETLPPGTQPTTFADEFSSIPALVRQDQDWIEAMQRRGINPDDVYLDIWAGGDLPVAATRDGTPVAAGTRIMRVLSFFRGNMPNPYDRPIEGVVVAVDMNQLKVLEVIDTGIRPLPLNSGDPDPKPARKAPAAVRQAGNPTYQVNGHEVRWKNWRFRYALHPRDGLVLYTVGYLQGGRVRPIVYRLGISEIYVPYGLSDSNWVWRTAFDEGEYGIGRYANALIPNVDVPQDATFLNARLADDTGGSILFENAVAIYEREGGLLWKRVDPTTTVQDARGGRELVITANSWIGNYIYGVGYIFRQDGSIETRVDLTGTTLNRGVQNADEGQQFGAAVSTQVAAPNHQHFFNFRIDFDVDGTANRVVEANVSHVPTDLGNAFGATETVLENEGEARRDASMAAARSWKIQSANTTNALGRPTAYALRSTEGAVPYSSPDFGPRRRASFVEHQLWVTAYKPDELYAAGPFPNQGLPGEGLAQYSNGESINNQDLVCWYTIGFTHLPSVEDYPVMPTATIGFRLTPEGFFPRNPALALPAAP